MIPAESNNIVAGFTIGELIYAVPKAFGLKSFAERIVAALVEPRVRIAMMWVLAFLLSTFITC